MPKKGLLSVVTKKIRQSTIPHLLTQWGLYLFVRTLFLTYRLHVVWDAYYESTPLLSQKGVCYFWHQHIISGMFFFHSLKAKGSCIVSPSKDGKIAGFVCTKLGFDVIYGSSTRSPIKLIKESMETLEKRHQLCVIGDGSRGPAKQLQRGVTFLAQKHDVPLVYVECIPGRAFTFKKSWDQFMIPLPWTKITIRVHKPTTPDSVQRKKV